MSKTSKSPLRVAGTTYETGQNESVAYRKFPKMNIVVDIADHLILSTLRSPAPGSRAPGPRPDVDELEPLLNNICNNVVFDQFLADAVWRIKTEWARGPHRKQWRRAGPPPNEAWFML